MLEFRIFKFLVCCTQFEVARSHLAGVRQTRQSDEQNAFDEFEIAATDDLQLFVTTSLVQPTEVVTQPTQAAPKTIKTIEKPKVNKTIGLKFTFFFSINSLSELPEIYEIYPGIKGNTQGDKKLINPAPKAINNSIIIFLLLL